MSFFGSLDAKSDGAKRKQPSTHMRKWRLSAKEFNHGYQCSDANCQMYHCRGLKRVLKHCITCKKRNSSPCSICNAFKDLIIRHAKRCQIPNCDLPLCKPVKNRMKNREQEAVLMQRMAAMTLGSCSATPGALMLRGMAAMTLEDSTATPSDPRDIPGPSPQQNRCGGLQVNAGSQVHHQPRQVLSKADYTIVMNILLRLGPIFKSPNIVEHKAQVLHQIKEMKTEIMKHCQEDRRVPLSGVFVVSAKPVFYKGLRLLALVKEHFLKQCAMSRHSRNNACGETSSASSHHEGLQLFNEMKGSFGPSRIASFFVNFAKLDKQIPPVL